MTSRIPVKPETLDRAKDFTKGLNAANYDEVLNFLLDHYASGSEDLLAAFAARDDFAKWKADKNK